MREVSLNSFSMQPRRNFVRLFIEDSSAAGDLFALVQHGDPPLHVTDVPHLDWS